jgi:hypothetical protein
VLWKVTRYQSFIKIHTRATCVCVCVCEREREREREKERVHTLGVTTHEIPVLHKDTLYLHLLIKR